ncbi:MAG: hypothetical protein IJZ53_09610 [Tyzzerella sp.]|nr:hypothetical protein [Tyzzerella sp.]
MKLEVGKTVIGSEEDCEELFSFEIQVRPDEKNEWSESFAFELSHDLAFEFTIPYGYQYRIKEADYSGDGYHTTINADGENMKNSLVYEGTMLESQRVEYINEKIDAVGAASESNNTPHSQFVFWGIGICIVLIVGRLLKKRKLE